MNINFISQALLFTLIGLISLSSCEDGESTGIAKEGFEVEFRELTPEESGIDFANTFDENELTNPFNYVNLYNGGGVAIGDINNDGLQDVVLTGNVVPTKLYLNKGGMKFEDITKSSGISFDGWATSVTMADVNNDGWLDIYICRAYHDDPSKRENLFYWNQKDGTFKEMASVIGINDSNFSIGASFFDYDSDGDL
ncbi:MAG: FG-GAP repeat domain-containing protein, partial [Chitinophagales bacterium]